MPQIRGSPVRSGFLSLQQETEAEQEFAFKFSLMTAKLWLTMT